MSHMSYNTHIHITYTRTFALNITIILGTSRRAKRMYVKYNDRSRVQKGKKCYNLKFNIDHLTIGGSESTLYTVGLYWSNFMIGVIVPLTLDLTQPKLDIYLHFSFSNGSCKVGV